MKDKKAAIYERERQVNTYAHMWHTALVLRRISRTAGEDAKHLFRGCLVFVAFSFEAFLNHLGHLFVNPFDRFERLSPTEKIFSLSQAIGFDVDYGRRPWQTVKHLFSYRNDIAHGKTVLIEIKKRIHFKDLDSFLALDDRLRKEPALTVWEKLCTEQNIERAMEDVGQLFEVMSKAAGIQDDLFIGGFGSSGIGPIDISNP